MTIPVVDFGTIGQPLKMLYSLGGRKHEKLQ